MLISHKNRQGAAAPVPQKMSCEFLHRTSTYFGLGKPPPLVSRRTIRCPTVAFSCQLTPCATSQGREGSVCRKHPQFNGHFLATPIDLGLKGIVGLPPTAFPLS